MKRWTKARTASYGTAVPIGGGATFVKDPRKVDPKGQALARELALKEVTEKGAREATVWLAYRPGDLVPRWIEVVAVSRSRRDGRMMLHAGRFARGVCQ